MSIKEKQRENIENLQLEMEQRPRTSLSRCLEHNNYQQVLILNVQDPPANLKRLPLLNVSLYPPPSPRNLFFLSMASLCSAGHMNMDSVSIEITDVKLFLAYERYWLFLSHLDWERSLSSGFLAAIP